LVSWGERGGRVRPGALEREEEGRAGFGDGFRPDEAAVAPGASLAIRPDDAGAPKVLDAVGDLYVLGAPLMARFEGLYAGHGLNNMLVRALMANPQAWRMRTLAPALAQVG